MGPNLVSDLNGLTSICGFTNDLDIRILRQHVSNTDSRDLVVVSDQDSDRKSHP
jgi:hypothetical protein